MENLIVASEEDLRKLLSDIVQESIKEKIPELLKKANRKDYYTIEETCKILDVSRRHLQYLRDTEQISYVKNGRKIYFKAEDLDEFFNDNYIKSEEV